MHGFKKGAWVQNGCTGTKWEHRCKSGVRVQNWSMGAHWVHGCKFYNLGSRFASLSSKMLQNQIRNFDCETDLRVRTSFQRDSGRTGVGVFLT